MPPNAEDPSTSKPAVVRAKALVDSFAHGGAWSQWPWRFYKSPLEAARVQPTFAACEWIYRTLMLACAWHAHKTRNWQLFFSSFICGSFNDWFFMAMSPTFPDSFWCARRATRRDGFAPTD